MESSSDAVVENGHEIAAEGLESDAFPEVVAEPTDVASTTLVEVIPGVAVVFGDVPAGLELVDFGLIPKFDREQLSTVLGAIGNSATAAGTIANAISSAQGLYRVDKSTLELLKGGAELAGKDGAKLGALFKNGKIVGQARFISYGVSSAQVAAALGPSLAMIALQMQLSEISGLVSRNIALTTQTLKMIHHQQWAELSGLVMSIDRAVKQASEIEGVTKSLWDNVAGNEAALYKQLDLYRRNVNDHVKQLGQLKGASRRQFLETNAEAILFDSNALLYSLKAQTGYQTIRVAWARAEGSHNKKEAQLVEVITRDAREEFDIAFRESAELVELLRRELRIIAELPGRATMPLTKKRGDAKTSRLTCNQLLDAIEPLANVFHPITVEHTAPEVVCAPVGLEIEAYIRILRWFLKDGEQVRAIAFPYQPGRHNLAGVLPPVLGNRVDATWSALADGKWAAVVNAAVSSTFVAVTDSRVITASPRDLLRRGELGETFPLQAIEFVRPPQKQNHAIRATVDVITEHHDIRWMFPSTADTGSIERFVALLTEGAEFDGNDQKGLEGLAVPSLAEGGALTSDA